MSAEPMPRLNRTIVQIDALWRQQWEIDWATLEVLREQAQYAQVWGFTLPACPVIVEGSISEVDDAR